MKVIYILLRRVLLRDEISLWPNASLDVQKKIKQILLQVLYEESLEQKNRSLRRKICDIVGELASSILEDGQWEELLPTLFQWGSFQQPLPPPHGNNIVLKETTLRVFEMISIHLATNVFTQEDQEDTNGNNNIKSLYFQLIQTSLQDPNGRIALNAIRAYCMLLMNIEAISTCMSLQHHHTTLFMPLILQIFSQMFFAKKNFDDLQEILEILIELLENHTTMGFFFVIKPSTSKNLYRFVSNLPMKKHFLYQMAYVN
jgi:hypothetical protein